MQYFIGFNQRKDEIFDGLFNFGATLMFYYHPYTMMLNERYKFYDGEWMFYSCQPGQEDKINDIKAFLEQLKETITHFEYEIVLSPFLN